MLRGWHLLARAKHPWNLSSSWFDNALSKDAVKNAANLLNKEAAALAYAKAKVVERFRQTREFPHPPFHPIIHISLSGLLSDLELSVSRFTRTKWQYASGSGVILNLEPLKYGRVADDWDIILVKHIVPQKLAFSAHLTFSGSALDSLAKGMVHINFCQTRR